MKTGCDYCGGRFGLVRHRQQDHQFCKQSCETAWLAKRQKAITDFKSWLYGSLVRDSPQP
jgi:hypothetical protein